MAELFNLGTTYVGDADGATGNLNVTNRRRRLLSRRSDRDDTRLAVGNVTVSGVAGWSVNNALAVGGTLTAAGGTGTLNIGGGSSVGVQNDGVVVWPGGTINLDGGSLIMRRLTFNGGHFNFNAGRVHIQGNLAADMPYINTLLGPSATIDPGRNCSWAVSSICKRRWCSMAEPCMPAH